jgi:hypothetical protein
MSPIQRQVEKRGGTQVWLDNTQGRVGRRQVSGWRKQNVFHRVYASC